MSEGRRAQGSGSDRSRRPSGSGTRRGPGGSRGGQSRPSSSHIQPARRIAFDVLRAVATDDAYANLVLPSLLRDAGLSPADAALATELTYGTLRRQGTYDAVIAIAAGRAVDLIDPAVLDALRLGVHQLLSTRVAAHAAVNESVSLVSEVAGRGASGFANAVLRRVTERDEAEWLDVIQASARSDDERLGLRTAHPVWVIRALRRALAAEGREEELGALLEADNAAPEVTLVALPGLAELDERDAFAETPRPYAATAYGLRGGDPRAIVEEHGGRVRVQDEGSQLVALALVGAAAVRKGERWLDLCAGPGGKTALLAAEALQHGASLDANELVPTRARLVRSALRPVPLEVTVTEADGRELAASRAGMYDRILIDAPCTGLGALRRRPEARWRKSPADVAELVGLQEELLANALDALAPGGIAAYVTCSPHLAETAGVVETVLRSRSDIEELDARAAIVDVAKSPIDLAAPLDGSGHAQLWPHRHGTDAMFLALLRKTGETA